MTATSATSKLLVAGGVPPLEAIRIATFHGVKLPQPVQGRVGFH